MYGAQNMSGKLQRVVVRPPNETFGEADPETWHYTDQPDLSVALAEHRSLVSLLEDRGCEVLVFDQPLPKLADSIYVFDPVLVTGKGTIELRMGKPLRRGEEPALAGFLEKSGVPRLGCLTGDALAEAGDLLWMDEKTLAVGQGFRTNPEGLRQLKELLEPLGVEVFPVELPHAGGELACLHLLSMISIVAPKVAVVYRPLMSVPFLQRLEREGFRLLDVPKEEFASQAPNVLAVAPGDLVMLEGNPRTQALLEAEGFEVATYKGHEISLKAEGGPTCLTRPVLRSSE